MVVPKEEEAALKEAKIPEDQQPPRADPTPTLAHAEKLLTQKEPTNASQTTLAKEKLAVNADT